MRLFRKHCLNEYSQKNQKSKIGVASFHIKVSNLNFFDSILTPCKWPQIQTLQFTFNPREGHLALNILGSKWNWFYIWIYLWATYVEKQKKMILYIGPESIPRLCSMIEKWTLKKNRPGCYSESIFLHYFVTFSNHSKPCTLLI